MAVPFKTEGHSTVTPYLMVGSVAKAIEFLEKAFDAKALESVAGPDGTVSHAEVRVYDCILMLGGARGEWKPMPAAFYLYVKDTDAVYRAALKAGATSIMEPADQFYGDRNAGVRDPLGNNWWIATHLEDVSSDELAKRAAAQPRR